jgi:hypothetical protein
MKPPTITATDALKANATEIVRNYSGSGSGSGGLSTVKFITSEYPLTGTVI